MYAAPKNGVVGNGCKFSWMMTQLDVVRSWQYFYFGWETTSDRIASWYMSTLKLHRETTRRNSEVLVSWTVLREWFTFTCYISEISLWVDINVFCSMTWGIYPTVYSYLIWMLYYQLHTDKAINWVSRSDLSNGCLWESIWGSRRLCLRCLSASCA